jgi:N-acetyl sugar amidotransferase
MDTSDPDIQFDEQGICNHCHRWYVRSRNEVFQGEDARIRLEKSVETIKAQGKGKEFDCVIGVSGGVDSTTVAYHVKRLGLRPLAVHLDNGWNSELSVQNIHHTLNKLGIELCTHVMDWSEFRDLQLSFLKASVINAEIPTDHAIVALLYHTAARLGVRYVISGGNINTEGIMPESWCYNARDLRHVMGVHRRFGSKKLTTFPRISLFHWVHYTFGKGIKFWPILNYLSFNKEEAKKLLMSELGWREYGYKHYESIYTRFYQGYILYKKFNVDKRRAHLSTLVCSGEMTRAQALDELEKEPYPLDQMEQDKDYVSKKLGITVKEFDALMELPCRSHLEYPNSKVLYDNLAFFVRLAKDKATRV